MKKFSSALILIIIAVVSTLTILYLAGVFDKKVKVVQIQREVRMPIINKDRPDSRDTNEYRGPPLKWYKPGATQQMGLLFDPVTNDTLPLYGKEVTGRRDSYNYYTTTGSPGSNNIYPIPLTFENRDCMDGSVGCRELYGGERLSVLGKTNDYEAKIYRTENFY
jgi:hypothetical protein